MNISKVLLEIQNLFEKELEKYPNTDKKKIMVIYKDCVDRVLINNM